MAQPTIQARLCPHCANSIPADALKCSYCKRELEPAPTHEWPRRVDDRGTPPPAPVKEPRPFAWIGFLALGLLVIALGAFYLVGPREGGDGGPALAEKIKELQEKDQKIQTLESELAKLREGNQGSSSQLDELKAKLEEAEKDITSTQRKLADANREVERLNYNRVASVPPPAPRETLPAPTAPSTQSSSVPARRGAEPGVYETRRATTVYEEPLGSARVVTQIAKGTEVTVVRSVGDWLEVRSKRGNPPGFIRADDAMLIRRAN
ncbi:MAG: SH3b protein [Deltaproteobacteria bacterium]|nr:SH3b protein [Deltaproteobacteria bacterium]